MALYEATAVDKNGRTKKKIVEADTSKAARQKIKKDGLILVSLTEKSMKQTGGSGGGGLFGIGGGRVSATDLAVTVRQLASLIKANIPLVEALSAVAEQSENNRLKGVLGDIRQQVNEGSSLKKAMQAHSRIFTPIYINMIESGEASGTLPLVLERLASFSEAQVRLRSKVISAMTYPLIMVLVGGGLMLGIFTFVIPKLARVFESMNKTLPWYTQLIMDMSFFIINYWWLVVAAVVAAMYMYSKYVSTEAGQEKRDRMKLRIPLFGKVFRLVAMSRFSSTMATLLTGGVPLVTALGIVRAVMDNKVLQKAVEEAKENITEGQSIAEPLKASGEFPPLLIHMIAIGERTGELPEMLEMVAENYEEQVNSKVERLTAALEPAMILIMGLSVGTIVAAVFVPLMQLQNINT